MNAKKIPVRTITGCGMLAAVAVVLQYVLEFPVPAVIPSFIKLDFSDLPEILGAFAFGPVAGVMIALIKNFIHLLVSKSVGVGELSNFLLGAVYAFTAGYIYNRSKTRKTAVIAGVIASAAMAIVSLPINYLLIYPLYYNVMNYPEAVILGMYQAIVPGVKNIFQALIVFNVPFTCVKGLICLVFAMLIYKPLSPILKGRK